MKILFRTKDPLENTVVLDQVCLEKHILVNHPIMRRFKDRIRGTIQDPSNDIQEQNGSNISHLL